MTGNIENLNTMFEEKPDITQPASRWSAPFGFLIASVAGGLCLAMMCLPLFVPVSAAPSVASDYWKSLPADLPEIPLPQHSRIVDVQGNQIAEFYSENRVIIGLDEVSPLAIKALLSTEDARFYTHNGVDWQGVARAARNNMQNGENEGASTITQQLVKNTLVLAATTDLDRNAATEVSLKRKIEEIHYATEVEKKYSKDEILEKYFNTVLFSNGVYGIGTAAEYYFGVQAKDLTLSQSALLIGLLKNPSGYNPIKNPDAAVERRNVVLNRMVVTKDITKEEAEAAKAEPIGLNVTKTPNGCAVSPYPFYCQWVMDTLDDDPRLGATPEERQSKLHLGGLTITAAIDTRIQDAAQHDVDSTLGRDNRVATGVALVEPGTGLVKAMVQNRSWGEGTLPDGSLATEIVLPATAGYQPGSSFKIFTLAAALEAGFPSDAIINAPDVFNPGDMNVPTNGITNDGPGESGPLNIETATALSSNTYYAALQREVGVLSVAEMAKSLGLDVPETVGARDASFTLGVTNASPLQMSAAYATFAAGGLYCEPTGVSTIVDAQNVELTTDEPRCYQAVSKSTAATVAQALKTVIDGPLPNRTGSAASIGRPAGGKTGTTSSHSAAWFVGITPQLATSVWIGDPRGGFKYPLTGGIRYEGRNVYNVYASKIAAPLWKKIMLDAVGPMEAIDFNTSESGSLVGSSIVPDVRGMATETAVGTLKQQGFQVEFAPQTAPAAEGLTPGTVASQTPDSGVKVFNVNSVTITLTLTDGSSIPDVVR